MIHILHASASITREVFQCTELERLVLMGEGCGGEWLLTTATRKHYGVGGVRMLSRHARDCCFSENPDVSSTVDATAAASPELLLHTHTHTHIYKQKSERARAETLELPSAGLDAEYRARCCPTHRRPTPPPPTSVSASGVPSVPPSLVRGPDCSWNEKTFPLVPHGRHRRS